MSKLAITLLLLATAVSAEAAVTAAFARLCEAKVPVASCGCMVNELLRTRNGQIILDSTEAASRPEAERRDAVLAVANRYDLKGSELKAILDNARPLLEAAAEPCK